jgi:hypothetical protein
MFFPESLQYKNKSEKVFKDLKFSLQLTYQEISNFVIF